jgi:hypothetical protein
MSRRILAGLFAAAALLAVAGPAAARERQPGDDHGGKAARTLSYYSHSVAAKSRGADDRPGHVRHGHDDGPNHR